MAFACPIAAASPLWPLKAADNGHTLVDQRGDPFLIVADTGWCMVNGLTDEEIDTYLAARKAQGFNAIQFMLMAHHSGCAVGGGSVDRYGQSPFLAGDTSWVTPNEAYWSRVDAILDKIKALDMLALVTPAYLGYSCYNGDQGWCAAMSAQPPRAMRYFGRFLGQRYRAQGNMIWIAGGDANPMDYDGMDVRVDALMWGIASGDSSHQLITGHAGRHVSAFEGFGTHAWLTLDSAYDGESCPDDSMADQIQTEYERVPTLPVHSIEQLYDGEGASADCLLDQFFWIALGGGVGQSYGDGLVWDFLPGWNDPGIGINSPNALVQTNAAKLVLSRAFWEFVPDYDHSVVTDGYDAGASRVAAARATSGQTVMAYIPDDGTLVSVDMTSLSGTEATAWWYDPVADVASRIGTFETSGLLRFRSPGPALVLVLDDASIPLPPPAEGLAADVTTGSMRVCSACVGTGARRRAVLDFASPCP